MPEYALFTAPSMDGSFLDTAEPLSGPFISNLSGLARELSIVVVAGLNEKLEGEEQTSNTLVVIGTDGDVVAIYGKLHLYDAFGYKESDPSVQVQPRHLKHSRLAASASECLTSLGEQTAIGVAAFKQRE
ncbi:nitrilase-related carbon-nitrogen hydrolase [Zafaria sp. J156]|uniref:nitrilase-related carbon-nitrogen hydrolase n=1 Tax=Zafaria sp. J156 TaxID=3116490 RepID=UPI002E783B19|nr:nitrilase-related carbon-nitrogen hydrolase [Zafaria sp. J156]MEE1622673.1 nitrilase-related carbon-nitrogen hydrolase [Zafaria sp. J156]